MGSALVEDGLLRSRAGRRSGRSRRQGVEARIAALGADLVLARLGDGLAAHLAEAGHRLAGEKPLAEADVVVGVEQALGDGGQAFVFGLTGLGDASLGGEFDLEPIALGGGGAAGVVGLGEGGLGLLEFGGRLVGAGLQGGVVARRLFQRGLIARRVGGVALRGGAGAVAPPRASPSAPRRTSGGGGPRARRGTGGGALRGRLLILALAQLQHGRAQLLAQLVRLAAVGGAGEGGEEKNERSSHPQDPASSQPDTQRGEPGASAAGRRVGRHPSIRRDFQVSDGRRAVCGMTHFGRDAQQRSHS